MSEPELTQDTADPPDRPRKASFLRRKLPYVAVLSLAIVGVAYTNISHQSISGFWEFLAIAIGVVCVATAWPNVDDRKARFRLIWTQALHWATFLVIMNIMLLPHVQSMVPAPANSLVLLMLLALGTFLAGSKSPILGNLLSGPRHGTFGAGDRVAQTVRTLFALGRRASHRAWHHLLATPRQKPHRVIARERRTVRPVSRAPGGQMRQAGSCAHLLYQLPVSARSSLRNGAVISASLLVNRGSSSPNERRLETARMVTYIAPPDPAHA